MPRQTSAEYRSQSPKPQPGDQRRPSKFRRLQHALHNRCPRCYHGPLFKANPYVLRRIGQMPKTCPACELVYEPEPGFFFGALIVSYALAAPSCLLYFLLLNMGMRIPFDMALGMVAVTQLLLAPFLFHFSRSVWIYFHVNYDPEAAARSQN